MDVSASGIFLRSYKFVITHLLSTLRVLMEVLSHTSVKKRTKRLTGLKFRTFNGRFQVTSRQWRGSCPVNHSGSSRVRRRIDNWILTPRQAWWSYPGKLRNRNEYEQLLHVAAFAVHFCSNWIPLLAQPLCTYAHELFEKLHNANGSRI